MENQKLLESEKMLPSVHAAKWMKIPLLVDEDEMSVLFALLEEKFGSLSFYNIQGITKKGEGIFSKSWFLENYKRYILTLKQGAIPSHHHYQKEFCLCLSLSQEALYALLVDEERQMIKPRLPVIQIQHNLVRYCKEDHSFRCQVYGTDSFSWGLLVSYPQLYQDANTHEIRSVQGSINTELFKSIQKWVRHSTNATPFVVDQRKQNEPIRLGKKCFSWINHHPELQKMAIAVDVIK